jgi:nitroreductase
MDKNCLIEITGRRACRHFSTDRVDGEKLRSVLEAGRLAPSGFGLEPWRFLVVEREPLRTGIAEACFNQSPAATAPVLIVIAARVRVLDPDNDYVLQQLTAEAGGADPALVMEAYQGFHESGGIAHWAVGQCQIAASFMMLEAVHQGLATCPIGGFDEASLRKAVSLPEGELPALVLALGNCVDKPGPRMRREAEDVIAYL